jgi:hypothetical protein
VEVGEQISMVRIAFEVGAIIAQHKQDTTPERIQNNSRKAQNRCQIVRHPVSTKGPVGFSGLLKPPSLRSVFWTQRIES